MKSEGIGAWVISLSGVVALMCCCHVSAYESEANKKFDLEHHFQPFEKHLHADWDSLYYSEGRDNLDGDSLFSLTAEVSYDWLTTGVWYGFSPEQSYDELDLFVSASKEVGGFEFSLSYDHIRFPSEGEYDNELSFNMVKSNLPYAMEATLETVYSFANNGFYSEFYLHREWKLTDSLTVDFSPSIGFNEGYVAAGHQHADHAALSLNFIYQLSDTLSTHVYVTQSWTIHKNSAYADDSSLRDLTLFGVGMRCSF